MLTLSNLLTEQRNPRSMNLDEMTPLQIARTMNREDKRVIKAVRAVLPQVAKAIELGTTCLRDGGRIIYIGAGTSGRLGLLDAAECPPTFGVSPDTVVGVIAGGTDAASQAMEDAEDSPTLCQEDLERLRLSPRDLVIGLAASGRTPYVVHGLRYAQFLGCDTVAIACTENSEIGKGARVIIEMLTGPEVLTGSTRLKAGTAEKMVLNMISTGCMVGIGKTYENLMVDVGQSNEKLRARAHDIVLEATGCSEERASEALREADGHVKTAIVMILLGVTCAQANEALNRAQGRVRDALAEMTGGDAR